MKFVMILIAFSFVTMEMVLQAANCPDGTEQISSVVKPAYTSNRVTGGYIWNAYANITITANCDISPCITKVSGWIKIYSHYLENDPASPGEEFLLGSGAEGSGVTAGTCNLCAEGDTFEYLISYTPSAKTAYAPDRVEAGI